MLSDGQGDQNAGGWRDWGAEMGLMSFDHISMGYSRSMRNETWLLECECLSGLIH